MLAYIHPGKGFRYIGMAWGWTVYFDVGVWRCLY